MLVYREAVYQASQAGVEIVAQTVIWDSEGTAIWGGVLPSNLRDDEDTYWQQNYDLNKQITRDSLYHLPEVY